MRLQPFALLGLLTLGGCCAGPQPEIDGPGLDFLTRAHSDAEGRLGRRHRAGSAFVRRVIEERPDGVQRFVVIPDRGIAEVPSSPAQINAELSVISRLSAEPRMLADAAGAEEQRPVPARDFRLVRPLRRNDATRLRRVLSASAELDRWYDLPQSDPGPVEPEPRT